jgi:hypothetical protein
LGSIHRVAECNAPRSATECIVVLTFSGCSREEKQNSLPIYSFIERKNLPIKESSFIVLNTYKTKTIFIECENANKEVTLYKTSTKESHIIVKAFNCQSPHNTNQLCGSIQPIPKPATGHNPEPVLSSSHLQNVSS